MKRIASILLWVSLIGVPVGVWSYINRDVFGYPRVTRGEVLRKYVTGEEKQCQAFKDPWGEWHVYKRPGEPKYFLYVVSDDGWHGSDTWEVSKEVYDAAERGEVWEKP